MVATKKPVRGMFSEKGPDHWIQLPHTAHAKECAHKNNLHTKECTKREANKQICQTNKETSKGEHNVKCTKNKQQNQKPSPVVQCTKNSDNSTNFKAKVYKSFGHTINTQPSVTSLGFRAHILAGWLHWSHAVWLWVKTGQYLSRNKKMMTLDLFLCWHSSLCNALATPLQ